MRGGTGRGGEVRKRGGTSGANSATTMSPTRQVLGGELEPEEKEELAEKIGKMLQRDRCGGDGESLPDTPPNEAAIVHQDSKVKNDNKTVHPFSLDIKVDGMAVGLLILGLITRIVRLDTPKHVVFDEMHYGKYASLYLKNTFFFDSNPPLGKMLIALAGYWAGFDGKFSFDKIGQEYSENVPLWHLRFLPALAGSLITPTVYLLVTELGLSPYAGALAGLMVVFDTAILAQSRFILMESMMIFLGLSSLLCVLKFRKISHQPFTPAWFTWLSLSGGPDHPAQSSLPLSILSSLLASHQGGNPRRSDDQSVPSES